MENKNKAQIEVEGSLLKSMMMLQNYNMYNNSLNYIRLLPNTQLVLNDFKKYYNMYPDENIEFNKFYTHFSQDWHKTDLDENEINYYKTIVFPYIMSINEYSINKCIETLYTNSIINEIKVLVEKDFNVNKLQTIIDAYQNKYNNNINDDTFKLHHLDLSTLDQSKGLPWALSPLQESLGSLMPGQLVIIAADSDVGKSALCITQAVHIFKHLNNINSSRPILYATSEDTKEDLACRFLSNLYYGKIHGGFEEIISQYKKIMEEFRSEFNPDLFIGLQIRGLNDISIIKDKIKKLNPAIVIIDLIDKLSSSDDQKDLTKLYQLFRCVANDGIPIIGTSQSGNTSYWDAETQQLKTKKWLSDKDLANSKSGKQGAAYSMVMIGKDVETPTLRYINITKKKRGKYTRFVTELLNQYSLFRVL